jgi:hypothetical protein
MYDDSNPFHFNVLAPPSLETQEEAFSDIAIQLVTHLTVAVKDTSDMTQAAYVLAHCDRVCDVFSCAGYQVFAEFKRELRSDLRSALRKARQTFQRQRTSNVNSCVRT